MQNNHPIPIDLLFFLPRETKASDVFQAGSKGLSGGNNTLNHLVKSPERVTPPALHFRVSEIDLNLHV